MHLCLAVGKTVNGPVNPTLSDGTAGNLEPGSMTLPLCQKVVDDTILVTEEEIGDAMRLAHKEFGIKIEGAAGCALAGYLRDQKRIGDKKACVVICGSNIDQEKFDRVIGG
jgi:threonine dehydratase